MSWQQYVDVQLLSNKTVDGAAIFSVAGDSVWAASPGFTVKPEELRLIIGFFTDPSKAYTDGFKINDQKYTLVRADDQALIGKKGKEGCFVYKTKQALIVAHHPEDIPSGTANNTVSALHTYLTSVGY